MFVPGREGAPAAKCSRVRVLHQLFGLLPRADETARDAVDLVCETERFLLEADALTRLVRDAAPFAFVGGCLGFGHRATLTLMTGSNAPRGRAIPSDQLGLVESGPAERLEEGLA